MGFGSIKTQSKNYPPCFAWGGFLFMVCLEKQKKIIMSAVDRLLHEIRDGWLTADQRQERIQKIARLNGASR